MTEINCPYCDAGQSVNHDDGAGYDEGVVHHQECDQCKKTFVFFTTIILYCDVIKADCLNTDDGEHDWYNPHATNEFMVGFKTCRTCGEQVHGKYVIELDPAVKTVT